MKVHATLYGQGDEEQKVQITYEYKITGWFDETRYHVNHLTILDPLTITPSDPYADLQLAIAAYEGVPLEKVCIECNYQDEQRNWLFI